MPDGTENPGAETGNDLAELTGFAEPSQPTSSEEVSSQPEPAPSSESAQPAAQPTPGQPTAAPSAPAPTTQQPQAGEKPQEFSFEGRRYTKESFAEACRTDPSLAERVVTRAGQTANYQKKYEDLTDKLAQRLDQPPPATQPGQPDRATQIANARAMHTQIRTHYDPVARDLVEKGVLSADALDAFPDEIAGLLSVRDQLTALSQKVQQFESAQVSTGARDVARQAQNALNTMIDGLAQSGEQFGTLMDAAERQGFTDFLVHQVNPLASSVTPDFLRQQYAAWKASAILSASADETRARKASEDLARRRASGDLSGTRPAAVPKPTGAQAELDALLAPI